MFEDMPVEVYPIEKSGLSGISSFFRIARIIRDREYDILCIQRGHDIVQSWLASLLSGRRPMLMYIVHVADFINSRFLLGRMHGVVAISRHIARKILSFSPGLSDRMSIIHHGIDLTAFNASKSVKGFIRNRFGLSTDTPLVSSSGSMWKNQIEFLDALIEIRKEIPTIRYLLLTPMADMPQMREFKDHAAKLGVADSVLWLDAIRKEDMPSYYADIDIAISTFRNEGFGLWIVEALAMGTPVVAFDGGGVRDSLEGCPAGVLVKNGAQEMAAEVVRILKNSEVRRRMSESGPRWVAERFSRERMVEEYFRSFDSLVEKRSGHIHA
jgi:glycosyltransferase involved in cell wall biosynthesis